MTAPTIVYDLDGTLADTAGDLMGALNAVLAREGLAPLPVENARSLLGAGGRALIQRGFAASGRELDPQKLEALFGDFLAHYNAHICDRTPALSRRRCGADGFRASRLAPGDLHQQDGRLGEAPDQKLGVAERFAFICGQDTFGVGKPDPKPLARRRSRPPAGERPGDHGRRLDHRHQDRPSRGRAGDRGRLRLYRRSRSRTRPGPGDLALRRSSRPPAPRSFRHSAQSFARST